MSKIPKAIKQQADALVLSDIKEFGCHIINVFDPDGKTPSFSYSVGIQETTGAPEAIVIGVRHELGMSMIHEYNRRVRAGDKFERSTLYGDFLGGGFEIYVEPVKRELLDDYTYRCEKHYGDKEFATVQLIYPSTAGVWRWEAGASERFKANQPMLGRKRPDRVIQNKP